MAEGLLLSQMWKVRRWVLGKEDGQAAGSQIMVTSMEKPSHTNQKCRTRHGLAKVSYLSRAI